MQIIKYIMLFFILIASSMLGKKISKKYSERLKELEEMKTALNIFKTKINFTYSPIPEIFEEIAQNTNNANIAKIFTNAKQNMNTQIASISWEKAIDNIQANLNSKDKYILKNLSKLLGQTDIEGQTSQIDITQNFLEAQIEDAKKELQKNEKLYSKLGTIIGLAIVIILV